MHAATLAWQELVDGHAQDQIHGFGLDSNGGRLADSGVSTKTSLEKVYAMPFASVYLDKLIDELAKGKAMEKILRSPK